MSATADSIHKILETFAEDDVKCDSGNYSAGTRARAALQEIRKICKDRRDAIQAARNAEKQAA